MLARVDLVLEAFPCTDGAHVKPRPARAIGLSEHHQEDVQLACISSKVAGAACGDELDIAAEHPQFSQSELKVSSRRRCQLSRMTTLAMPLVRRRIGSLPEDLRPACVPILGQIVGVET